jgi:hypothetical protein
MRRRAVIVAVLILCFALFVLFMPAALDDPSAYPELQTPRSTSEGIIQNFPGE